MKTRITIAALLTLNSCLGSVFINLDFEETTVDADDREVLLVDWSVAAPGWSHSNGPDTDMVYCFGFTHVGITPQFILADSTNPEFPPLDGEYSLVFASGRSDPQDFDSPVIHSFISQTGTIDPASTTISLLAVADSLSTLSVGDFSVYLNDIPITMEPVGENQYTGDISDFAGMEAELKIVNNRNESYEFLQVDKIEFSPIPEPGTFLLPLLAFCASLFMGKTRLPRKAFQLQYGRAGSNPELNRETDA